jgi:hypothetical protein
MGLNNSVQGCGFKVQGVKRDVEHWTLNFKPGAMGRARLAEGSLLCCPTKKTNY